MTSSRHSPGRVILAATRIWLPAAIGVAGIVLIVIGHGATPSWRTAGRWSPAAGVALLIVAIIVWMLNWMYRLSVRSNEDREYEERAREYFDRTGRWPDEDER